MIVYRSRIFSPTADPFTSDTPDYLHFDDGYVAVENSKIVATGAWPYSDPDVEVLDFGRDSLITPGFFDTHLHAPQLEMIGSYGGHLLEWLNRYTFPTEAKFASASHAQVVAQALFSELLNNGTMGALMMSSIHAEATDVFFAEAERRSFRAIIGKTMMDRNANDALQEETERSCRESRELLKKWHGRGMLRYAITPRFAPTSTERLLELAGELKAEFPDAYVHTHVSENQAEVRWVAELFPNDTSYAGVYDRFGLLSDRTVLAHGVHLSEAELDLLRDRRTRIAHCPNSNLFLGSGLFPLKRVIDHGIGVGLGSDIGAGTTPSMFNAMSDAYKVQQVRGVSLSPFHLWYLSTLGGAKVLSMDGETGSLEAGKDADFLVLNLHATSLLSLRTRKAASIEDLLAGLIFMGDERVVQRIFVRGMELAHK